MKVMKLMELPFMDSMVFMVNALPALLRGSSDRTQACQEHSP